MDFTHSPLWVQVHDMPLVYKNIGATLGAVGDVDVMEDGVGWGRFLDIRVHLDLTKPLNRGRTLNLNGKSVWVTFKYEKLPQFCYMCGRIFHAQQSCTDRGGVRLNDA